MSHGDRPPAILRYVLTLVLLLVSFIHLGPLIGVAGPEQLSALYGVTLQDPNLVVLMRHRAVLFGIVGTLLLVAAFVPRWQLAAMVAGTTSLVSFLWLASTSGELNANLQRVAAVDWIAFALLAVGFLSYFMSRKHRRR